jgi:sialate O-acetylesterase
MARRNLVRMAMVGCVLVAAVSAASAAVRLPAIFSDNMVLQREQPVPVWGWAEPGKEVTVTVAGQSASAKAARDGRWKATLPKLPAGGPHQIVVQEDGGSSVTLRNVLIGEVWLCSGQSNMWWTVTLSLNPKEEIAAAKYPKIRLFNVKQKTAQNPQDDCQGSWAECSSKSVPDFSAVGYFFIRHLHKELDVPAGMIESAWGGTAAEAWTCRKVLESESSFKPMLDRWDLGKAPPDDPNRPANLYNGMIAPLVPFAIRGAIWYQGESNCGRAYQYRTLLPMMITNWRTAWGQGDFPFGVVQLAPFRHYEGGDKGVTCAELREAQTLTMQKLPNVGMAVITDISDLNDIHPKNKQDVGRRLALWALAKVYGKGIVYSGPMYKSMSVEGNKVRIRFDHVGGGLVTRDGKAPSDFLVAGKDQQFVPATAAIDGDAVVVSSEQVAKPVAVRFGWRDAAEPNLANKEGLPACPFRTDQWKGVTEGRN